MRVAHQIPGNPEATMRSLLGAQPTLVEITTPAEPGNLMEIPHGLGRIPLGYTLCDPPYALILHGREASDSAHSDQNLYVRFSVPSTSLKLLVF